MSEENEINKSRRDQRIKEKYEEKVVKNENVPKNQK